jgi:hypothetical protein
VRLRFRQYRESLDVSSFWLVNSSMLLVSSIDICKRRDLATGFYTWACILQSMYCSLAHDGDDCHSEAVACALYLTY